MRSQRLPRRRGRTLDEPLAQAPERLEPPAWIAFHAPLALAVATGPLAVLAAGGLRQGWWSPRREPPLGLIVVAAGGVTALLAAWRLIGIGFV
jgi:hypothetical protein